MFISLVCAETGNMLISTSNLPSSGVGHINCDYPSSVCCALRSGSGHPLWGKMELPAGSLLTTSSSSNSGVTSNVLPALPCTGMTLATQQHTGNKLY